MDKVVALVVTYNRKELLQECLDALLYQTYRIDRIMVLDNASTDGTEDIIKTKYIQQGVLYKKMDRNTGGSGGFHYGMKYINEEVDCDWIWLMDDDTIATKDALKNLIYAKEKIDRSKKDISYLASSVVGMNGEPMNVPAVNIYCEENGYPHWYKELSNGCVKILNATFVSILVNKKAVEKIGYPVKWYFLWGDDTEYTLRLNKFYGPSYLVGSSQVIHKRKNSANLSIFDENDKSRLKNYYYYYRNALINYKEYYGSSMVISFINSTNRQIVKSIIKGKKYTLKKVLVIYKAVFDYMLGKYCKNDFKNRMKI